MFWTLRLEAEGRVKSGRILDTEPEWGKVSSEFPTYPCKETSAEVLEDFCIGLWKRDHAMNAVQLGMQMGIKSMTCQSGLNSWLQLPSETKMHLLFTEFDPERTAFSLEACQVKLLNYLWTDLKNHRKVF